MMDKGEEVPPELREETRASIDESIALIEKWHGQAQGRIRCCFAPRFAISCTSELLQEVAALARERGMMIHTHSSENKTECEIVESETGRRNVTYLDSIGVSGEHVMLAHCIHLDVEEMEILARTGTNVSHCPSSNLKLGSGLARVAEMLARKISVSLGADGAACNNRLDMFTEMRSAALLQKLAHGPEILPATTVLQMATIDGARALGLAGELGSIENGKRADVSVVDLNQTHASPRPDVISALVYATQATDVRTTIINGQLVMRNRELLTLDEVKVVQDANREAKELASRAGIFG